MRKRIGWRKDLTTISGNADRPVTEIWLPAQDSNPMAGA